MAVIDFLQHWHWWVPLIVLPMFILLIHIGVNCIYKYLYPKEIKKGNVWSALVLKTLNQPFKLFVWFSGLSVLVTLYAHLVFEVGMIHMISNLLRVGVIIAIAWTLYIFTQEGERALLTKKSYDLTTIDLFSKLSLIGIIIFTLLLILPLFGIQIAGILAFGGFSGIIVGMAAKDAIANVIGGFIIAIDKPFKIGDWIRTMDDSVEGIVEHIGWRLTKVRTFEKRPVYIPNSLFSSIVITNVSRMSHRRILTRIGLRYADIGSVEAIAESIYNYIETSPDMDQKQSNYVNLVDLASFSVDLEIRAYTKVTTTREYYATLQKFLLDVHKIIESHGAQIPYPIQTVHLEKEATLL